MECLAHQGEVNRHARRTQGHQFWRRAIQFFSAQMRFPPLLRPPLTTRATELTDRQAAGTAQKRRERLANDVVGEDGPQHGDAKHVADLQKQESVVAGRHAFMKSSLSKRWNTIPELNGGEYPQLLGQLLTTLWLALGRAGEGESKNGVGKVPHPPSRCSYCGKNRRCPVEDLRQQLTPQGPHILVHLRSTHGGGPSFSVCISPMAFNSVICGVSCGEISFPGQ